MIGGQGPNTVNITVNPIIRVLGPLGLGFRDASVNILLGPKRTSYIHMDLWEPSFLPAVELKSWGYIGIIGCILGL